MILLFNKKVINFGNKSTGQVLLAKKLANMNIQAVFFDIDGTLVPFGDKDIPKEVKEAIAEMRRNGIKVFIATGRHVVWIDNIGDTEFDGYVSVNGGMCTLSDKKTVIFERCVDPSDVDRLAAVYPKLPLEFCIVPDTGDIFITGFNENTKRIWKLLNVPSVPVRDIATAKELKVVQLMGFGDEKDWNSPALYENVLRDCEATSWNPYFCDIVPHGSSKSVGIDEMLRYFGIDLSRTMAFGDGDNDLTMLRHCAIGVAMGNASDSVKAAADYVTSDVTDHGVVKALRHFGLIK